jgi:uncharacterized protein (TIRG00374 family)
MPSVSSIGRGWLRNAFGILLSISCLVIVAYRIDFKEVLDAIVHFRWSWLVPGVGLLAFGYAARVVRWSVLLNAGGAHVSPLNCTTAFIGSIALNNVLPMRLGDLVRALVFPGAIGVRRIVATASLVMERLVDLMTLLVCLVAGVAVTDSVSLPSWLINTSQFLSGFGLLGLALLFLFSGALAKIVERKAATLKKGHWNKALSHLIELLSGFDAMSRPSVLVKLFLLSVAVWAGEAGLFWSLLWGFGLNATVVTAFVVMAIATLSTLVPSSPGYVGPFHLAVYAAVVMFGGSSTQAASFAVIAHLGIWLPTTVAGAIAILFNPQLFSHAKVAAA